MLLGMGVHPKIVQEILGHKQISMTLDTLSSYRRDLEHWQQDINNYCRSIGVRYVQIPAERSLDAILLGDFRRYGLLE